MAARRRHYHRKSCKTCGALAADGVPISATGQCPPCGETRYLDNHRQLKAHSGPYFVRWRARIAASVGAALLDDPGDTE